jgi:hypothetical protein
MSALLTELVGEGVIREVVPVGYDDRLATSEVVGIAACEGRLAAQVRGPKLVALRIVRMIAA